MFAANLLPRATCSSASSARAPRGPHSSWGQATNANSCSAEIRNVGATRTPNVTVALKGSRPGEAAVELAREVVRDVPLTGSASVVLPWKAAPGTHQLKVVVDPDGESGDTNRDNNEAMVTIAVPGEASIPAVRIVEPAEGAVLKDTIFSVKVQATDAGGLARVEGRVDGGLFKESVASGPQLAREADRVFRRIYGVSSE
ncbi:MAG: hypothetical protein HY303_13940, partial [Candidatus Wallbacteria bacterium]|nr:hypothetical protein [Candidatus Wallbacteria bacterium]